MSRTVEPDRLPAERHSPRPLWAGDGRGAALGVAVGGLVVIFGSFATWDTCPKIPCEGNFGLFSLMPRSGISIGLGVVTAELGLLLALIGVAALRRGGTSPFRAEAVALGLIVLLSAAIYLVRTYVVPEFSTRAGFGAGFVVGGAVLATIGGARLRPRDRSMRLWARARRPALALLLAGIAVWSLALAGLFGPRIEPISYAVILIALGVGLWPGRLPFTRLEPATMGTILIVYGAVSLAGIVLGDFALGLLEAAPIVVLVGVVLFGVLELPVGTSYAGQSTGRIDRAAAAIRSKPGLMVAALLLTSVTVVLVIVRLLAGGDLYLRYVAIDRTPAHTPWLALSLAAGLAMWGGLVVAFARRSR